MKATIRKRVTWQSYPERKATRLKKTSSWNNANKGQRKGKEERYRKIHSRNDRAVQIMGIPWNQKTGDIKKQSPILLRKTGIFRCGIRDFYFAEIGNFILRILEKWFAFLGIHACGSWNFHLRNTIIIRELAKRKEKKKHARRKYEYVINTTRAIHLIRDVLIKRKGGSSPPDLEALISKETLPLRPGRRDPRKVSAQSVISFNYRFS